MGSTLLLFALLVTTSCGSSDGGGQNEDVCASYCDVVGVCTNTEDARQLCNERCLRVFEKIDRVNDPEICAVYNRATFDCASTLMCSELNQFLTKRLTINVFERLKDGDWICDKAALDCCEEELLDVINSCPLSFRFAPGQ